MAGSRPKAPGWYPEPDIHPGARSTLRYWNGRHWTDRRRPMPILTSLDVAGGLGLPVRRVLEGPARIAELAAPAAEISATRDATTGFTEGPTTAEPRRADLPLGPGGGGRTPPEPPSPGGGGGGDGGGGDDGGDPASGGAPTTKKRKKKWWVYGGVAVLAAVAVALAGQAMRPPSPGPRVLTDINFVRLANSDCAKTIPTLRPPDIGPLGTHITDAQAADQVDKAANGLDDLANRLGRLPAPDVDRPHIIGWLDGWHQYVAAGHDYAADLRLHGSAGKQPASLARGATAAKAVDNFSRANGLNDCLFAFNYTPDPSQF